MLEHCDDEDFFISIHASRVGGDLLLDIKIISHTKFQSTPPGWEATADWAGEEMSEIFQSTPPGWEATCQFLIMYDPTNISIHASRVGGD